MNSREAAQRWKRTWESAWPRKDAESIVALYAPAARYRALAFRAADEGTDGVRHYLAANFAVEEDIACWFGDPIVDGERAVVEWWGTWVEDGQRLTLAGATLLRFDADGRVIDHRDYWNQAEDRVEPYRDW